MNKAKLTAGIVLIFILGVLTGVLSTELYHKNSFRDHPPRPSTPEERTDFIMKRLARDLDLTDDQAVEIRPIVEESEKAMSELMDRISPEREQIMHQGFMAIREKLNPDQQVKLDEIRERIRNFRRKPK